MASMLRYTLVRRPSEPDAFLDALYKGTYEAVPLFKGRITLNLAALSLIILVLQQGYATERAGLIVVTLSDEEEYSSLYLI